MSAYLYGRLQPGGDGPVDSPVVLDGVADIVLGGRSPRHEPLIDVDVLRRQHLRQS